MSSLKELASPVSLVSPVSLESFEESFIESFEESFEESYKTERRRKDLIISITLPDVCNTLIKKGKTKTLILSCFDKYNDFKQM